MIICFYNRIDLLRLCLDSLRTEGGEIAEVVIADDGSDAAVVRQIEGMRDGYGFPLVHAWHPRQGPRRAATRNNGIRHARGEYLLFIDADFLVLPGMVRAHLALARPGRFVAGRCKYLTESQTERVVREGVSVPLLSTLYGELPEETILKEHREFVRYGWLRRLGLAGPRRQTFGGHFSAFKGEIERINGYDENYVGWGGEDQDFALRMVLSGVRGLSAIREARTLHLWHPREMGNAHWKEGANVAYFLRKDIPPVCEQGLVNRRSGDTIPATSSQDQ